MAPVKVKIITAAPPCGPEVTVDIEAGTDVYEVKRQLAAATGIPMQYQKVLLSGIAQIVLADKRSHLGFSHCGSTNNFYFAVNAAKQTA